MNDQACDYIYLGALEIDFDIPGTLGVIQEHSTWLKNRSKTRHYPLIMAQHYSTSVEKSETANFVLADLNDLSSELIQTLNQDPASILIISTNNDHGLAEQRRLFFELIDKGCDRPVIISRTYENLNAEQLRLYSSTDLGGLLVDGLGDGVFISSRNSGSDASVNSTSFGILQATRTRISKTEYISCPSCGRTLFDLQEVTAKIRSRTEHLKGVKIGIMGCIVNGLGEMADADYGYVGTGPGKISLYKEKEVVKRNIPEAEAVDELISLIQDYGDWTDPETTI